VGGSRFSVLSSLLSVLGCDSWVAAAKPMPGYSGTPLPKKLGIKDGFRIALMHAPTDVKTDLSGAFKNCSLLKPAACSLYFVFLSVKSRAGLELDLVSAAGALAP